MITLTDALNQYERYLNDVPMPVLNAIWSAAKLWDVDGPRAVCKFCQGSGRDPQHPWARCPICHAIRWRDGQSHPVPAHREPDCAK